MHDGVLFDNLDLQNGISGHHLPIERKSEVFDVLCGDRHVLLDDVDVEVCGEIVHVSANRVSIGIHSEKSNDWLSSVLFLVYRQKLFGSKTKLN